MSSETVFTRQEVAVYLRVSTRTINSLMKDQGLPHYKTGEAKSCKVLFPKNLVDEWQAARVRDAVAAAKALQASDGVKRRPRRVIQ